MHYFLVFLAALSLQARAAEIEKLALMSVIGDTMSVVVYQPSVGSHLDQNRRQVVTLEDDTFDQAAVKAAAEAIGRLPGTAPMPVVPVSLQAAARTATTSAGRLLPSDEMRAVLLNSGASHLLLFSKYRAGSLLKMAKGATGTGHLEGLGFYIDRSMRMRRSDTGELGTGFLAPFAYFRVSLIDLTSWEILKDETVRASNTLSAARLKEGGDPWGVLTAEQKVSILQRLIRTETSRVVPLLLVAK